MKKMTILAMATSALAYAAPVLAEDGVVKMGALVSLSGGGASFGGVAERAWQLAVEDINANGGIMGQQVELIVADTQTDPTHAVSEARRLVGAEGIEVMVGPVTSQEVIPVSQILTGAKIAQVSTASSSQLTPQFAPYHFSNSPTGLNQMVPNIDYAIDVLGLTKIAIISDNGGMSKAAVEEMSAYMASKGAEPVAIQEFGFRAEDMTPQIFSLRRAGAEAVLIINSLGDDSRKFLQNLDEIGWDVPVLGNLTMTNFAVGNAKLLGETAFANVLSVQFSGMSYCEGDPVGTSEYAKFVARANAAIEDIDKMGGAAALVPWYIEPMVLKAAVEGAGTLEGDKVAAWLEENAASMPNMLGTFSASSESHFLPGADALVVVKAAYAPREDGLVQRVACD